jgi:hypothetical protein
MYAHMEKDLKDPDLKTVQYLPYRAGSGSLGPDPNTVHYAGPPQNTRRSL